MIKLFLFLFVLKIFFNNKYSNNINKYLINKNNLNNLNDLDKFYGSYNLNNYTYRSKYNVGNDERFLNDSILNIQNEYDNELFQLINYDMKKNLLDKLTSNEISNLQKYELIKINNMFFSIKKINISEGGLFNDYNFLDFDE